MSKVLNNIFQLFHQTVWFFILFGKKYMFLKIFLCFSDDAVRIISAGGFSINQQKVKNPSEVINSNVHRLENNVSLLRVGKKNYYIVKWYS